MSLSPGQGIRVGLRLAWLRSSTHGTAVSTAFIVEGTCPTRPWCRPSSCVSRHLLGLGLQCARLERRHFFVRHKDIRREHVFHILTIFTHDVIRSVLRAHRRECCNKGCCKGGEYLIIPQCNDTSHKSVRPHFHSDIGSNGEIVKLSRRAHGNGLRACL